MKVTKKTLWLLYLIIQFTPYPCLSNPFFVKNPFDEKKRVEFFVKLPPSPKPKNPVLIMIHGHQKDPRPGGLALLDNKVLGYYAQKGFIAVAVSQPGYGHSEGPPDFCGPCSQAAVKGVIAAVKERPDVNPSQIFLHGKSRGALVASMVATQDSSLAGLILDAGFYNLRTVKDQRTLTNLSKETKGMIENIEMEATMGEEAMHLRSAADYISQIKCPTLMFHGFNDERAPVQQAIAFSEALSQTSTPVQLHLFSCGHHTPLEEKRALIGIFLEKSVKISSHH